MGVERRGHKEKKKKRNILNPVITASSSHFLSTRFLFNPIPSNPICLSEFEGEDLHSSATQSLFEHLLFILSGLTLLACSFCASDCRFPLFLLSGVKMHEKERERPKKKVKKKKEEKEQDEQGFVRLRGSSLRPSQGVFLNMHEGNNQIFTRH